MSRPVRRHVASAFVRAFLQAVRQDFGAEPFGAVMNAQCIAISA
jgi:hypothetical protein